MTEQLSPIEIDGNSEESLPTEPDRPVVEIINQRTTAPVRWRETISICFIVALFDLVIYRGHGYSGYSLLFLLTPILIFTAAPHPQRSPALWIVSGLLIILSLKLFWSGTGFLFFSGFVLLISFSMLVSGFPAYIIDIAFYACQTFIAGGLGLFRYSLATYESAPGIPRFSAIGFLRTGLPIAAVLCFGTIFIMANPDLANSVYNSLNQFYLTLSKAFWEFSPDFLEFCLWVAVAWISIGLIRPIMKESMLAKFSADQNEPASEQETAAEAPLFIPFRNTLIALSILFSTYLVFEFRTLWFRSFPEGFHYSGYAHEGAAWLTIALALATFVLSTIFRGDIIQDTRLPKLQKLAWAWSSLNFLLALAVYNRLFIYIGFNGMTRMRTVGLFGISAVVIGFVLVIWKIIHRRDFIWLIHRQLWTLAFAIFFFCILPVDMLVHTYNVRRILDGDPAPSVQISVHPINSAGFLTLTPLLKCENKIIREGVRAMLAERAEKASQLYNQQQKQDWTSFQLADHLLFERLSSIDSELQKFNSYKMRESALKVFQKYAYHWY